VLKPLGGSNPLVSAMKRAIKGTAVWVLAPTALLVVAIFALTLVIRYPNPVAAFQLAQSVPSEQPELMPSHLIPASLVPHDWESAVNQRALPKTFEYEGESYNTADVLRATSTNALLIVKDGVIEYESYADGFAPDQLTNAMSIGKTMVGMAVGILINDGLMREQESITSYLPQFEGVEGLDQVKIQHLLDMQSCIGIDEDYPSGPAGWGYPLAQMFATTDIEFVLQNNLKVVCDPGSEEYVYRSVNSQLLGMAVKSVTGLSLANFIGSRIWAPIGASTAATWSVDKEGGWEKSYCCFNTTARDLALVGGVFLNQGRVGLGINRDEPILSEDWYLRMTTPAKVWFGGYGSERFGANMWHRPNGSFLTQGYRGQFMVINPNTNTIVVKFSDDVESLYYDQVLALLDELSQ
jgi:CubicO group peptidase (beta-lactamase class C family)